MLDVLLESRIAKSERPFLGVALSAGVHVAIVMGLFWLAGPRLERQLLLSDAEHNTEFLFPKIRGSATPEEHLTYIATGLLTGTGVAAAGAHQSPDRASPGRLQMAVASVPEKSAPDSESEPRTADNAYNLLDVDSAAVRDPTSAAPEYPTLLMTKGIEGSATMRFVVDSTGVIDMGTVLVLESSHPEFVKAVREAMPRMRFKAARVGPNAVRQLAEQQFRFELRRVVSAAEGTAKKR